MKSLSHKGTRKALAYQGAALLFALMVAFWPKWTIAQQVSGTITGYVTDPSGAAIPGATVTAINVATGVAINTSTDTSGLYTITHLIPGTYTVSVEAKGFRKFVRQNVILNVDSTVTVDGHMEVGAVTQQVTVTGAPPLLNMTKADVSATLPAQEVESLPTPGRNISELSILAPGVVQNDFQQGVSEQPANGYEATANGQYWGTNNYQIDGISDTQFGLSGYQVLALPADAVQEMKVTTADYDPELGSVAGMVVQYVTKSGTNQFHGSAYEFNENSATFAANPYTEKIAGTGPEGKGTGVPFSNQNVFGGSLGGPIKRNKLFFFGDYEGNYSAQGTAFLETVPTQALQSGNLTAALGPKICYDPSSPSSNGACGGVYTEPFMVPTTEGGTIQAQENMIFDPDTGNSSGGDREAFTLGGVPNMIPANMINTVSENLMNLLDQDDKKGVVIPNELNNNFSAAVPGQFYTDQGDARIDYDISQNDRLFFRYSIMEASLDDPAVFGLAGGPSAIGTNGEVANYADQLASLDYTHMFGPSLVGEFRFGTTRFSLTGYQSDSGSDTDNQVGILGINRGNNPLYGGLAGITVSGPTASWTMGDPTGQGLPRLNYDTQFEWASNWNWMKGSHQIRWGVDFIREREPFLTVNESSRGSFEFSQEITADNGIPDTGLGQATFLLGTPSEYSDAVFPSLPDELEFRGGPYLGDDIHVTKKLTANVGLRWDYIGPSAPSWPGGGVNFDPATGDLVLACLGQVTCHSDVKPNYGNFAPRVGLAYALTNKTVIRAGYGRSYFSAQYGGGVFGTLCCSYPVQTREDVNQVNTYFPITMPGQTGSYEFNATQPVPPPPAATLPKDGLIPLVSVPGLAAFAVPFHNPTPSVDSYNFTVQRQLASNLSLSVAYVGSVTRHVYGSWDLNAPYPGPAATETSREPLNEKFGIDWEGIDERCACEPASYNSLQVLVDKPFTRNYSFHSVFTWEKDLDTPNLGAGDPYDRMASYGPDANDRAIVWNVSHELTLPYGKGQRFGSNASGIKQAILGGWVFDGITSVMSGLPEDISWEDTSSVNSDFGQRPNIIGNPMSNVPPGLWYNPAVFVNPTPYNYGNDDRVVVGPHYFEPDWALWKEFKIREGMTLQVRAEAFNLFNSTNKALPNATADSATAGLITDTFSNMRELQFGAHLTW